MAITYILKEDIKGLIFEFISVCAHKKHEIIQIPTKTPSQFMTDSATDVLSNSL